MFQGLFSIILRHFSSYLPLGLPGGNQVDGSPPAASSATTGAPITPDDASLHGGPDVCQKTFLLVYVFVRKPATQLSVLQNFIKFRCMPMGSLTVTQRAAFGTPLVLRSSNLRSQWGGADPTRNQLSGFTRSCSSTFNSVQRRGEWP